MPNDLLMFIVINLIKRNVNIEENAIVHGTQYVFVDGLCGAASARTLGTAQSITFS